MPDAFACRGSSALSLLVLGVFADNTNDTLSLDDFALFADRLNGRSNLHNLLSFPIVLILGANHPKKRTNKI